MPKVRLSGSSLCPILKCKCSPNFLVSPVNLKMALCAVMMRSQAHTNTATLKASVKTKLWFESLSHVCYRFLTHESCSLSQTYILCSRRQSNGCVMPLHPSI